MDSVKEVHVSRGALTAVWEYIGEGWSGDFDPDDPEDTALLRFSVYRSDIALDDASYCTQMPVGTDEEILRRGLERILDAAEQPWPKRALEALSWMKPSDFLDRPGS